MFWHAAVALTLLTSQCLAFLNIPETNKDDLNKWIMQPNDVLVNCTLMNRRPSDRVLLTVCTQSRRDGLRIVSVLRRILKRRQAI